MFLSLKFLKVLSFNLLICVYVLSLFIFPYVDVFPKTNKESKKKKTVFEPFQHICNNFLSYFVLDFNVQHFHYVWENCFYTVSL